MYAVPLAVGLAILIAIAIEKRQQRGRADVDEIPGGVAECLDADCGELAAGDALEWMLAHTRATGHNTTGHQPI